MAASHSTEIADPPDTFKSPVWKHFGFSVEYRNGIRVVEKTHTICLNCFTKLSRILAQLRRHHPNIDISGTRKKPQKQETFPTAFRMKLQANSDRAQTITKAIWVFMALDMRQFSVVENIGLTHLLSVLEPRYHYQATAFQSECAASPLQRSKSQTSGGPEQ